LIPWITLPVIVALCTTDLWPFAGQTSSDILSGASLPVFAGHSTEIYLQDQDTPFHQLNRWVPSSGIPHNCGVGPRQYIPGLVSTTEIEPNNNPFLIADHLFQRNTSEQFTARDSQQQTSNLAFLQNKFGVGSHLLTGLAEYSNLPGGTDRLLLQGLLRVGPPTRFFWPCGTPCDPNHIN
jgi:hypothetical protein